MSLAESGFAMTAARDAPDSIGARNAGLARVSRLTRAAAVLALAGTGVVAAFAASSFHARRLVALAAAAPARARRTLAVSLAAPSPTVTVASVATPPPTSVSGAAPSVAAPAPAPPSTAPAPTPSPPVVVSGGS